MSYIIRTFIGYAISILLISCGGAGGTASPSSDSGSSNTDTTSISGETLGPVSTGSARFTPENLYSGLTTEATINSTNQESIAGTAYKMLGIYLAAEDSDIKTSSSETTATPPRKLGLNAIASPEWVQYGTCGGTFEYIVDWPGPTNIPNTWLATSTYTDYCSVMGITNGLTIDRKDTTAVNDDKLYTSWSYTSRNYTKSNDTSYLKTYLSYTHEIDSPNEFFTRYKSAYMEQTITSGSTTTSFYYAFATECTDEDVCKTSYITPLGGSLYAIINDPVLTIGTYSSGISGTYYDPTYGKLTVNGSLITLCDDGSLGSGTINISDQGGNTLSLTLGGCSSTQATLTYNGSVSSLIQIR